MNERIAIYCGTRNLYHDMIVAAKSLLYHRGADEVVFLIEDDKFPEKIPDCIRIINVADQQYFSPVGPNYKQPWTYMSLMRVALPEILDADTILSLDVDTIVRKNIDELWNTDLSRVYFGAVPETTNAFYPRPQPYFNSGVMLMNLAKLRENHFDNVIIHSLNVDVYRFPEQDALNRYCAGRILQLAHEYNYSIVTGQVVDDSPAKIRHYAASEHPWNRYEDYKEFDNMTWDEVLRGEPKPEPVPDPEPSAKRTRKRAKK